MKNLVQLGPLIQKIANNDDGTKNLYGGITFEYINNITVTSLASFHDYANKQLSEENLKCDVRVIDSNSDATSLENYTYNLEQSVLTLNDFKKFKELTEPELRTIPQI